MPLFRVHNGAIPGAAMTADVTTGTAIKTMIQIATPSSKAITLVDFWFATDSFVAEEPIDYALVRMPNLTTPATVTAYAAADITKVSHPTGDASLITLGTTASGFTSSNEGTLVSPVNILQGKFPPSGEKYLWWPPNERPVIEASSMLRFRVLASVARGMTCGISWWE